MKDLFKDKIYANSFYYIKFKGLDKDLFNRRNQISNNKLYSFLYQQFQSSNEICKHLKKPKVAWRKTAEFLDKIIKQTVSCNKRCKVLSFGAGFGFIESYLSELGHNITGIEFNQDKRFWNPKVKYQNSIDNLEDEKYDFIYIVSVLYSLEDHEIKSYLSKLHNLLNKNGILVVYEQDAFSILESLKWLILSVLMRVNRLFLSDHIAWGYLRTDNQLKDLCSKLFAHQQSYYFDRGKNMEMLQTYRSTRILGRQLQKNNQSQLHIFRKTDLD